MHSEGFRAVFLGTSLLSVITISMSSEVTIIKPVGPKMCEQHCDEIMGCSYYMYDPHDLSCHVADERLQFPVQRSSPLKVAKPKESIYDKDILSSCPNHGRIFQTKQHKFLCRRNTPEETTTIQSTSTKQQTTAATTMATTTSLVTTKSTTQPTTTRSTKTTKLSKCSSNAKITGATSNEEKMTRLLLLGAAFKPIPEYSRQLNLHEKSVQSYVHIKVKMITLALYSSVLKRLVVAGDDKRIYTFLLDSNKGTILKNNIICDGMAEDKQHKLVFFSTSRRVNSIKTIDSRFVLIVTIEDKEILGAIAVDIKRRTIFLCLRDKKIISINYITRNNRQTVAEGRLFAMTFDDARNTLYYSNGGDIYKRDVMCEETKKVASVNYKIRNMMYYENTLYTSSQSSRDHRIGVITSNNVTMLDNRYDNDVVGAVIITVAP